MGGSLGRGADYSYIDEDTTDDGYSRAEIEYAAAVTAVSAAAAPTSTSGPNPFNYITSSPYDDGLPAAAAAASPPYSGTAYGRPIGLPTTHLRQVSNGGWMNQTELYVLDSPARFPRYMLKYMLTNVVCMRWEKKHVRGLAVCVCARLYLCTMTIYRFRTFWESMIASLSRCSVQMQTCTSAFGNNTRKEPTCSQEKERKYESGRG